jgi:hypothetical protein
MSIKFVCPCGKHLRAREEMARMRILCPACGRPVSVPSREPTQRGTRAEPLAPPQRSPTAAADDDWLSLMNVLSVGPETDEGEAGTPDRGRRRRRRRVAGLGAAQVLQWFGELLVGLAFWLTALSGAVFALWLDHKEDVPWLVIAPCLLLFAGAALGCACGLWWSVLRATATGDPAALRSPVNDPRLVLQGTAAAVISFLAGPVVLVSVGYWFWLNSGDLTWVDQVLLLELGVVAVGAWLLGFAAAATEGRLRDALPPGVVRLVWRLGWRGLTWAGGTAAILLVHVVAGLAALEAAHDTIFSWLLLFAIWTSGLFWTTALVRLPGKPAASA